MDDGSRALLAIGLLLLSVPIWAPYLDITGRDYVYEHAPITVEGGEVSVDGPPDVPAPADQIACFGEYAAEEDRVCRLEAALLADNLSVDPAAGVVGGMGPGGTDFVVFGTNGPVYERTFAELENGSDELGLRQVDPEMALDRVGWNVDRRPTMQRVLENGQAQADERITSRRSVIVDVGDRYAIVYESGTRQFLSAKPGVERGLEAILLAIGGYLVFRAGRRTGRFD